MEFITKKVRSRPGLSQEQALVSLQGHPEYRPGTQIKALRRQADRWVATLLEPKEAIFPPKVEEDDEDAEEESPLAEALKGEDDGESPPEADDSDDSDSDESDDKKPEAFKDEKPGEGDEKSEEAELGEVLSLLHKIVEGLGIDLGIDKGLGAGPEGPLGPKPPPPVPGGPGAGPPGAGGPPKGAPPHGRPLRDVPPGTSPMAGFSNTRVASFSASTDVKMTVKQAKTDLEAQYPPYKVKQIKRSSDGKLHALLSLR